MGIFRSSGKVYKPAAEVNLGPDSDEFYIHANVKAPRVAGLLVKIFVWILESWILGPIVVYVLKKDNLIHKLVSFAEIQEPPLFTSTHNWEEIEEQNVTRTKPELSPAERVQEAANCLPPRLESILSKPSSSFKRWTIQDFARSYMSGETTPLVVAKRFLAAVKESSYPTLNMAFFINYDAKDILRQAEESSLRYQRGTPISLMDGILVAIKDEIDCMPYPTTGGTKWLQRVRPCIDDANCVKQLRACGAILVGKTNMHELGAGTSGINPHYGATRNPYKVNKVSGGSSSGSAAVVCAGLCPIALGVDGGGSVRMPAAMCGVVGLKPTSGRLSSSGVLPLNWTVGMPGILAATVEDALIALVPFAEIEEMRLAHYVTIGSECTASLAPHLAKPTRTNQSWTPAGSRILLRARIFWGTWSAPLTSAPELDQTKKPRAAAVGDNQESTGNTLH